MSELVEQHRGQMQQSCRCCVITISDSRTLQTDSGGALIVERLTAAGHVVQRREIIADEPQLIATLLQQCDADAAIQVVLFTGGTGISGRDQTYETVTGQLTRLIPGYGELFRHLSYQEIGSATILSRTVGGLLNETVVLTMPGSPAAVKLAMDKIILPELSHLVNEATKSG
ncbi:MAG TPA: molybdenum cofactor biosynthesis protein [Planctomycetes bacterium]|nr:molybdenum cofactor biosynthesis protein [Planctomycetota bacterium]